VIDAQNFRALSSFNPGDMTPEAFDQERAEERLAVILQNIGRAFRGEANKTVVLIVLNSDPDLEQVIRHSPALLEGSEMSPVFGHGDDIASVVAQANQWLKATGGPWPDPDPEVKNPKHRGRRRRSRESILQAAEVALEKGMSWREFRQAEHPERVLSTDELTSLKARFGGREKRAGGASERSQKTSHVRAHEEHGS
jgi:hypothetical protein